MTLPNRFEEDLRAMNQTKEKSLNTLLGNVAFMIYDIARLYRTTFDVRMKEFNLGRSEWLFIIQLGYFEGSTQQELTELMDIGKGGIGKLIDRLEKLGLVLRTADSKDRRIKRIHLTSKGRELALRLDEQSEYVVKKSTSALDQCEQKVLMQTLTRIRNELLKEPQPDGYR